MKKFTLLAATLILSLIFNVVMELKVNGEGEVPGIPANLEATAGSGVVNLSWDSVAGATYYNIYFSRHPGINESNWKYLAGMRISRDTSPYQLTGLNNGTTYYFVVTAKNLSGESLSSNEVSATPSTSLVSPVQFNDISPIAGLDQTTTFAFGNPVLGDINNDGNLDIIDHHHHQPISLYQNNGDETFTDIIGWSGIKNDQGIDRHGFALGDYNNDGNLDLFIGLGGTSGQILVNSQLWKGDGTGKFTDVTSEAGFDVLRVRQSNFVDYNNDGYVDLFVSFADGASGAVYKNDKNGYFHDVTDSAGLTNSLDLTMSFADYDNDGNMDLFTGGVNSDKLYHNNGDGAYILNNSFVLKNNKVLCRSIAWGDYNNDGFVDLYVSRGNNDYYGALFWDQSRIDFSYINTKFFYSPGELTFRCDSGSTITFDLLIGTVLKSHSIYIGSEKRNPSQIPFNLSSDEVTGTPVINTGQEDAFFVWKEDTDNVWHIQWTKHANTLNPSFWGHIVSDGNFSQLTVNSSAALTNFRSTLYRNNGDGTFTNVTEETRTGHIGNNGGAAWGDFDNDGYLDLYVVDASDILGNRTNTLYRNLGDGTFDDITETAGVGAADAVGRHYGASWGDLNNDGNLDLFLSNGFGWGYPLAYGKSILYKNLGNGNNWIKIKLVGTKSNRSGIGARVVLNTSQGIQTRQLNGNGGELYSQGVSPLHFGLGNVSVVDAVNIFWPSGAVQTLSQISANQELTVIEANLNDPLVAHYPFDEGSGVTATDTSGNGNDGAINGATWIEGKSGNGLSFDGTSNYVSIPLLNHEEISIAAWFYKNTNDTTFIDAIFGGYRWNPSLQLREGFDVRFYKTAPNRLEFILVTQDGSGNRTQKTAVKDLVNSVGSWYHVVGTYNKATGKQMLYVNGHLANTRTHPAGNTIVPLTFYSNMRIGKTDNNGYFNGIIDDVRIYNRALTDQEVQDLYNAL